jgi:anaerobic magnesium-protoporphyrin IX monomethyl ester cyclase
MKRKIIFIEPKSINLHIFKQFKLPRLGLFILGSMMKKRGWDVEIIIEEANKINFKKINDADMVGISTITATANRAYAIADKIRLMGIPVIMGGPHVTFLPEEALNHADFVIKGEGERSLMSFIDEWEKDRDYNNVPNLAYIKNGILINNPINDFIENLDELPYPDFSQLKGSQIVPIQTSRGCPFDCEFCSVTGMFGKRYRFRSVENILDELKQYDSKKHYIFFYDDNFTANRIRAKELLNAMIKNKLKFKWSTQVRTDIVKDLELVKLMKKAGCTVLYIGLESVNPDSLLAMKKNQTVADISNALKILTKHKFHIHGMFVYGFDDDTKKTVNETIRFAKKAGLTSTQFLILTPLPGSELYEKMKSEKRIIFDDWSLYDTHHVVFQPKNFDIFELQWAQIRSHKKFYSVISIIKRIIFGKWLSVAVSHYARGLNKRWQKKNIAFLKTVELLKAKTEAVIKINYSEIIKLDD